ncbi:hypothetical protein KUCAC02_031685, partial [Chaenocephalus aceratus]
TASGKVRVPNQCSRKSLSDRSKSAYAAFTTTYTTTVRTNARQRADATLLVPPLSVFDRPQPNVTY